MRIRWLASFPKSGNTWVRFLLYHYLYGELTDTSRLGEQIPDIHAGDMARVLPSVQSLIIKTHWGLSPRMPHVDRTVGAIYIVRNPKDVLFSMLNYYRLREPKATWTDEHFARLFISGGADPGSLRNGFGTWEDNVLSWCTQRRFPFLIVRYEDLKADTARELRRMIAFLAEPVDESRILEAVRACTLERMKALEAREKAVNHNGNVFIGDKDSLGRGLMHINKGNSGQKLAAINPALDAEFDQRFANAAWLTGYGQTLSSIHTGQW